MQFENGFSTAVRTFFPNNLVSFNSAFKLDVCWHLIAPRLKSLDFPYMVLGFFETQLSVFEIDVGVWLLPRRTRGDPKIACAKNLMQLRINCRGDSRRASSCTLLLLSLSVPFLLFSSRPLLLSLSCVLRVSLGVSEIPGVRWIFPTTSIHF